MKEVIIEFEGYNGICTISGFMFLEDADDEKPLQFYDENGFEIGYNYPSNPYQEYVHDSVGDISVNGDYQAFNQLLESMQSDELLIQYLVDYADESALIQREGYDLRINKSS